VHVVVALRAALRLLAAGVVVAAVWLALADGAYRPKLGLALMGVGGLIALMGGTGLSRLEEADARAFLGRGPARDEPTSDGPLTTVGAFLFVSLPLVVLGGLVYGRG
jgi:uncharacterized membrane protein YidH (DUF202 family)